MKIPELCHYCGRYGAAEGLGVLVKVSKSEIVSANEVRVFEKVFNPMVPRCERCRLVHRRDALVAWVLPPLPVIAFAVLLWLTRSVRPLVDWETSAFRDPWFYAYAALFFGAGAFGLAAALPLSRWLSREHIRGVRVLFEHDVAANPEIRAAVAGGWSLPESGNQSLVRASASLGWLDRTDSSQTGQGEGLDD